MDRRAIFFLMAAAASAVLIPVVPDDVKNPHVSDVGPALVVACLVLALLSWLDHRSGRRQRP